MSWTRPSRYAIKNGTHELTADQPRFELAGQVRACATAAGDEAEFVRRMRRHGLLVRARVSEGHPDIVTGYSVAQRPVAGERPIWGRRPSCA